jgi:hypothetical protein
MSLYDVPQSRVIDTAAPGLLIDGFDREAPKGATRAAVNAKSTGHHFPIECGARPSFGRRMPTTGR